MAALTRRGGAGANSGGNQRSVVITAPTHFVGDLMITAVYARGDNITSLTATNGWTKILEVNGGSTGGFTNRFAWFYKKAASAISNEECCTIDGGSSVVGWDCASEVYYAATAGASVDSSPIHNYGSNVATGGTMSNLLDASTSTSVADCRLIGGGAAFQSSGNANDIQTTSSDWTENVSDRQASGVGLVFAMYASAGAVGTGSHTKNHRTNYGGNGDVISVVIALKPEVPPNTAPTAPTLGSPASGTLIDRGDARTFSWTHNDPEGNAQASYQMIGKNAAGATVYDTGEVGTSTQSRAVAANALPETMRSWTVRTKDPGGLWGPYASDRAIEVRRNTRGMGMGI